MLFITDQVEDITGYKPEDFTGQEVSFASVIHAGDLGSAREIISEAITGKKKFDLDYRLVKRSGEIFWVHEAGRGVYDKDGNVLFIDGIITDISDKKKAEDKLQETRTLVKNLTSNLTVAVSRCLFDEHFTILTWPRCSLKSCQKSTAMCWRIKKRTW